MATALPPVGRSYDDIMSDLHARQIDDVDWRSGRGQLGVYVASDDVMQLAKDAYGAYFSTNALTPYFYPSVGQMAHEIVAAAAKLMHAPEVAGVVTTGGTESILLAVLCARNWARAERPGINQPEMILAASAHPAFFKAAEYFDVLPIVVPLASDLRADVEAMRASVTPNTIMMVGSAPEYAHGQVDPIADLAPIALAHDIHFHVDGCVGGFVLPFLEQLDLAVPDWDFRVPGVRTISADLHKFGYSAKGASLIMHRSANTIPFHTFSRDDGRGGGYTTPTVAGTQSGGIVAAAWAVMQRLGEDGYRRIVAENMETTRRLVDGISAIPGLHVWGTPVMHKFSYGSRELDIRAVADQMEERGWTIGVVNQPLGIFMHITPLNTSTVGDYLRDLTDSVEYVRRTGATGTDRERYN